MAFAHHQRLAVIVTLAAVLGACSKSGPEASPSPGQPAPMASSAEASAAAPAEASAATAGDAPKVMDLSPGKLPPLQVKPGLMPGHTALPSK